MIAESEIAKRQVAANRRLFPGVRQISDGRLDRHDRLHALPARRPALIDIYYIADRDQRPDEAEQVHVEFGELADSHLSAHGEEHPNPRNQHEPKPD